MTNADDAKLNDVDFDSVVGLVGKIQEEPDVADSKWSAHVKWKGGFRSEATIRDFDPVISDEPPGLGDVVAFLVNNWRRSSRTGGHRRRRCRSSTYTCNVRL